MKTPSIEKILLGIAIYAGLYLALYYFWIGLEYVLDGQVIAQRSDGVIGTLICINATFKLIRGSE